MNFALRAARLPDVSALVAIESESFTSPHWKAEDFLKYETWVAESDGKIAGFLVSREILSGNGSKPAEREILNLAVAPEFRRRGIATALILHAVEGPGNIFLEVRESNLAAQELYRKLGFIEVGRRPKYYESPEETAIVMKMK